MKQDPKLIICIGIPASGKTTWVNDKIKNNKHIVAVSRDKFRLMLKDAQVCTPDVEKLINKLFVETCKQALISGKDVIVDNTNCRESYINDLIEPLQYYADIDYRVFDISLSTAIERDNNRQAKVGEEVIKRMHDSYKNLMQTFHFQPVKKKRFPKVNPKITENQAVIFDIDGTLALMADRCPYDLYSVILDEVVEVVKEQMDFHRSKKRTIIVCSGRSEGARKATQEWFDEYGITYDHFYMRKENDSRKDCIIKKEIYENNIKQSFDVLCVYDDRLQVVELWHSLGLYVFNCNQGNREF